MSPGGEKARLAARVESQFASLVDLCRSLVRIDSTNPPGDTAAVVEAIEAALGATAGIEHRRVVGRAPVVNLVARVRGAGPGRRLVLNGHLDTFPIGEARWQHHPLGADLENGRIDGRGACDMKAGVAALVLAFVTLAEFRDAWGGELVLALVGDEETGGRWGTQYLLANVEEAVGDAMLNADTGSPRVVRVCEKDNVWVELEATGVANHAVHVHLGRNAVDALVDALGAVRALAALAPSLPAAVERTIAEAKAVSEAESGEGEAETLRRITVNIGRIEGGIGVNTIPDPRAAPLRLTSHVSRLAMLASLPIPNRIGSTAKCPRSDQQRPHQYSPNNENRQVVSPILRAIVVDRAGPANAEPIARSIVSCRTPWRLVTSLPHHRGAGASSASTPNACRSKDHSRPQPALRVRSALCSNETPRATRGVAARRCVGYVPPVAVGSRRFRPPMDPALSGQHRTVPHRSLDGAVNNCPSVQSHNRGAVRRPESQEAHYA